MNILYRKNELAFSLVWIFLYILLFSTADRCSAAIGTEKIVTAPLCVLFVLILWTWLRKNHLYELYGLCRPAGSAKDYLFFLPLIFLASVNLWMGVHLRYSATETVLYVVSMLCVGLIEEILFRGFLFQALRREGTKRAILISSLTFGFGHIVNLLNGAGVFSTLLQICYASAVGFLFPILFYNGRSLIPCIAPPSLINTLSAFSADPPQEFALFTAAFLTIVSLSYAFWVIKRFET